MGRKSFGNFIAVAVITAAFSACNMLPGAQVEPAPTPAAAPAPTPGVYEALAAAQLDLERALSELRSRNRRGALEMLDQAATSLGHAAVGASTLARPALDKAVQALDAAKTLIQNKDKKGEEALAALERTIAALVEKAASLTEETKPQQAGK
ncbi:MAG: hypothetical protein KF868_03730 [Acidobacteria bacterium]|nr:hypothetical protein [Acidobacteriota bacterium]MCW5971111.1 hypothetical protein [Blastocatellales bacterium]